MVEGVGIEPAAELVLVPPEAAEEVFFLVPDSPSTSKQAAALGVLGGRDGVLHHLSRDEFLSAGERLLAGQDVDRLVRVALAGQIWRRSVLPRVLSGRE